MPSATINLGDAVRDQLTGFEGIVYGHSRFLTGCDQWLVVPTATDRTKYPDANWFDDGRLEVVQQAKFKPEQVQGPAPGGPRNDLPSKR